MEDVTVKQVHDTDGHFTHIEIHQGDQMITLSLRGTEMDSRRASYKWANLKEVIDTMQEKIKREVENGIGVN